MKKAFLFALALSFVTHIVPVMAEAENVKFFVSGSVAESGDGSLEKPFKTLEEARNAVRELNKNNTYPEKGVIVMVRGGDYYLTHGLNLTGEDSGKDGAPVTWCAYPGEDVKFIGGAELNLSDFSLLNDASVISKMDSSTNGKIYQVNLTELGIEPYDELNVTGHASHYTTLFGITEGILPVPELYYNGKVMPLAQYPDIGEYMKIGDVVDAGDNMEQWYNSTDPNKPKAPNPGTFKVDDERISRWKDADQAWVFGYWRWDWSDQTMPVEKIDVEAKTIKPGVQSYYTIYKGQRFYIYNLLEELTTPGEWFLDKNTGYLYIYPYDTNPESTVLLGFSSNPVVTVTGAKNIKIKDIEVTGSRNCGVKISESENISLSYMSINKISGEGIVMSGKNLTVEGCHIYTLGKKGIDSYGGDFTTLEPSGNKMINNHIHDFGRIITTYEGGIRCNDVGALIKNNLIYDGTHLGLNIKGNDIIVEYNDVHNVLKTSSDMGAIYSGQIMAQRGNIFRYNAIHDCNTNSGQTATHSIIGIYLDDMFSGTSVYGNLIYNIGGNGVFINGGRDNMVKHNIFANCTYALTLSPAGVSWGRQNGWDGSSNGLKEGHRLYVPFTNEAYSKYPHMNNLLEDEPLLPKYNVITENVNYNVGNEFDIRVNDSGYKVSEIREMGTVNDGYSTVKDIGFKDVLNNDFSLKDDSEVYEKYPEFEKIDANKIGLISSQLKGMLQSGSVALAIGKPVSYVNWQRKVIDSNDIEVVPFIRNNKTYVPLRFLSENLGATVEWKDYKAYVDYNGTEYVFENGNTTITRDGEAVELEAPMIIENSRIFLPLRDVSELFGKEVFWDDCGLVVVTDKNIEKYMNEERVNDLYNRM